MADSYPATVNWTLKCEDAAQQVEQQNAQEARVAVNRAFSNPGFLVYGARFFVLDECHQSHWLRMC